MTLSFGAAFAASEDVRDGIYSAETRTVAVDNTYIANRDLSAYLPRAEIISVTEDDENYYVSYQLSTIDVVDAVWRDVVKDASLRVSKAFLGEHLDLGLHVTKELGQVVASELDRLRETQLIERRQVTPQVVATEYGGLVGRFLDPTIQELPGYVPVVTPPQPPPQVAAAGGAAPGQAVPAQQADGAPVLTVLGDSPVVVPRGAEYRDLGVTVSDSPTSDLPVRAYIDGGPERTVGSIVLDTTYDRVWHIRYEATDGDGNTGTAERYVLVGDAVMPGTEPPPADGETPIDPVPPAEESPADSETLADPVPTTEEPPTESPAPAVPEQAPVTPPADAATSSDPVPTDPDAASGQATSTP